MQALTLFRETFSPKGLVYYPCSFVDTSPTAVFGENVLYLDRDERATKSLQGEGLKAITADALQYDPGEVGVLILQQSQIEPDFSASFVTVGGFVICSDFLYHFTARSLSQNPDFELKAVLRPRGNGFVLDTELLIEEAEPGDVYTFQRIK